MLNHKDWHKRENDAKMRALAKCNGLYDKKFNDIFRQERNAEIDKLDKEDRAARKAKRKNKTQEYMRMVDPLRESKNKITESALVRMICESVQDTLGNWDVYGFIAQVISNATPEQIVDACLIMMKYQPDADFALIVKEVAFGRMTPAQVAQKYSRRGEGYQIMRQLNG